MLFLLLLFASSAKIYYLCFHLRGVLLVCKCVCAFLRVQAMEGGSPSARKNPEWQSQTVAPSLSEWLCGGHLEQPASEDLAL